MKPAGAARKAARPGFHLGRSTPLKYSHQRNPPQSRPPEPREAFHARPTFTAALDYAAHGLPVFPCAPRGKTPAVARGFHRATTNPATIRRFWTDPDRNVAIPTGASSQFWVLDIDGEEGEASLRDLEARHGAIPKTRSVVTSRGRHVWFAYPGPVPSTGRPHRSGPRYAR